MNISKFSWIAAAAVSGLAVFGLTANAAEKADPKPALEQQDKDKPVLPESRLKRVAEELKLTDEQKEKIRPVFQEVAKKVRELRQEKETARAERLAKFKEVRESFDKQLKPILSQEQWEKWQNMRDRARQRRRSQDPVNDK